MLKSLLLLLIPLIGLSVSAQDKGYLVTKIDSSHFEIKFQDRGKNSKLFYRNSYETTWHEIYASNAESAVIPGKALFLSLKLPDEDKKVWARCFFDGTYKLVRYDGVFYIVGASEIVKLDSPGANKKKSRYIGRMILLFSSKINYDFSLLSYQSKSLIQPLIQYHKKEKLPFVDYNKYISHSIAFCADASFLKINGRLYLGSLNKVNLNGNSYGIGVSTEINYPDISKRISFSFGLQIENTRINQFVQKPHLSGTYFIDLDYNSYSLRIPVLGFYKIVNSSALKISFGAGVEVTKIFASKSNTDFYTMKDNIVQPEFHDITINDKLIPYQVNQIVVGIPKFSESLQLGAGISFPLTKVSSSDYVFTVDRSGLLFVRYAF